MEKEEEKDSLSHILQHQQRYSLCNRSIKEA